MAALLLAAREASPQRAPRPHAHRDGVSSVAFSPDGALLASAGDRTVRLWESRTGRPLRTIRAHGAEAVEVWFLADGSVLSVGSDAFARDGLGQHEARVWDPSDGRRLRSFPVGAGPYALSPDRGLLAAGNRGQDTAALLFDTASGRREARLQGKLRPWLLAFSPDGRLAVYGTTGRNCQSGLAADCDLIEVWDLASGRVERRMEVPGGDLMSLAGSADGRLLAGGHVENERSYLSVWDMASGCLRRHWLAHSARVQAVEFSPDGHRLYSGARFGEVASWSLDRETPLRRFGPAGSVGQLAVSPDGRLLAQADSYWASSLVLVWDAETGRLLWSR